MSNQEYTLTGRGSVTSKDASLTVKLGETISAAELKKFGKRHQSYFEKGRKTLPGAELNAQKEESVKDLQARVAALEATVEAIVANQEEPAKKQAAK